MRTRIVSLPLFVFALAACLPLRAGAQQVADPDFKPPIARLAYAADKGPVVLLDEAHYNFHTASGRYLAFAELLRRDGYRVLPSTAKFSRKALAAGKILVIANALAESNQEDWSPPNPSAFTDEEIAAVREWVNAGGSLLLIADHLPFSGAAEKLAAAFGVRFHNGYAAQAPSKFGPIVFRRSEGSLKDHLITRGRADDERIDAVANFTGSAFHVEKGGEPLLVLSEDAVSYAPSRFGQGLTNETPRVDIPGWWQGGVLRVGRGRVAIFGEAAMFSAQLGGPNRQPIGMNAPVAKENPQFLLNVLHWLSGLLDK